MTEPTTSKRVRRRQAKKREILEAALTIAVREGLEGLTMHKLASELDVAVGGLYRYFDSKLTLRASLQRLVIDEYREAYLTALAEAGAWVADQDATPQGAILFQLFLLLELFRALADQVPTRYRLLAFFVGDPRQLLTDEQGVKAMQATMPVFVMMGGLFTEAQAVGAVQPGEVMDRTLVFWSCILGITAIRKLERFSPDILRPTHLSRVMAETLLKGWGATDRAIQEAWTLVEACQPRELAQRAYPVTD